MRKAKSKALNISRVNLVKSVQFNLHVFNIHLNMFVNRFLLSLSCNPRCLVVDDQLTVLPISSHALNVVPVVKQNLDTKSSQELEELKESLRDTQPVSALINCCKTLDQVLP